MDSYMRRQLDSYIMGEHIHEEDNAVLHRCPQCGLERRLPMFYELGGWFYPPEFEDQAYCEKCKCDLEIIEKEREMPTYEELIKLIITKAYLEGIEKGLGIVKVLLKDEEFDVADIMRETEKALKRRGNEEHRKG